MSGSKSDDVGTVDTDTGDSISSQAGIDVGDAGEDNSSLSDGTIEDDAGLDNLREEIDFEVDHFNSRQKENVKVKLLYSFS